MFVFGVPSIFVEPPALATFTAHLIGSQLPKSSAAVATVADATRRGGGAALDAQSGQRQNRAYRT